MLTKADAAYYCGRKPAQFERECPHDPAVFANGDKRWDRRLLDHWLDSLATGALSDDEMIEALG